jgi:hypothetical protein
VPLPSIIAAFPRLRNDGVRITSPEDYRYNCIAFAAGDVSRFWWPDVNGQAYWPPSVQRTETLTSFIAAYRTLGYSDCPDGSFEEGFEKIAIYVSHQNTPTHAARQLRDGRWTSKLGPAEDIKHDTVNGVSGQQYGQVAAYMKRRNA